MKATPISHSTSTLTKEAKQGIEITTKLKEAIEKSRKLTQVVLVKDDDEYFLVFPDIIWIITGHYSYKIPDTLE